LAVEYDASALTAEPGVGLKERNLVPGAPQEGRCGETAYTAPYDYYLSL
jgi:hypothetical protein